MKVTANNILLLTCLLLYQTGNSLWAQKTDYRLREVVIQGSAKEVRSGAYQITVIDSALLEPGESTDLNTLLAREAGLYFTSYGSTGSLSTLRLRGSGGSHTQVNWNGFPVNSITAGSEDLSLIPVTSLDQISVVEGAPGSRFGSGTFGGAINLDNRPDWTNRFNTRISGGFGSWHYRNSSINIQTGNSRLQYHLSGYQKSAWNNYPFINVYQPGKPLTKRTNDSLHQYGFQQHLFLKLPDQIYIQAGMWGYMHHKDLPESMASTIPGSSTQSDRSLNSYLRLIKQYHNLNMEIHAAFLTDSLTYTRELHSSDSTRMIQTGMHTGRWLLSPGIKWFVNQCWSLNISGEWDYQFASASSYRQTARVSNESIASVITYKSSLISGDGSFRLVMTPSRDPVPLFGIGIRYQTPFTQLKIRGNFSNKFRIPTLNEQFWYPGGNPDLLPESGWGGEVGWDLILLQRKRWDASIKGTLYRQWIHNWILWVPDGPYWSPKNIKEVLNQGIELNGHLIRTYKQNRVSFYTSYSYTQSHRIIRTEMSETVDKGQLAYVPVHLFNSSCLFSRHSFDSRVTYRFVAKRYTTDDHDPWLYLHPVHQVDISAGYKINLYPVQLKITARIENLLNQSVEWVRAYPAPGRSYYLTLLFYYKKNQSK